MKENKENLMIKVDREDLYVYYFRKGDPFPVKTVEFKTMEALEKLIYGGSK